jgi:hypothetical protein
MPVPDPLLFGAYFRASGEDRVTEVLATVLQGAPQLAERLAAAAGLPRAARYAVETQVRASDSVLDLEIRASDEHGDPLWVLWSEHKKDAPFSPSQLTRYSERLVAAADGLPSKLIAITLWEPSAAVRAEAASLDVPLLRWRDLLQMAENTGEQLGGAAWRTKVSPERDALAPRLLREWLVFCRHELQEELVEPLTPERVAMVAEARLILESVDGLVEQAMRSTCAAMGTPSPKPEDDYWWSPPPKGSWAGEHECSLYLKFEAEDQQAPLFAAGIWNEGQHAEALRADAELLGRLEADGYRFWDDGTGRRALVDISAVIPMGEIAASPRLEDQQRALADFAERALTALSAGGRSASG